jgi:drug/metabolite transporter (DMT)-like permease
MKRNAEPSAQRAGTLDAIGAIVLWSTLAVVGVKLKHVPAFFLVGTALVLGGLVGVRRLDLRAMRARWLLLGVYGLFAYHFCLFIALRLAPPIEANLINYLWPLFIVVLSPLVLPGTTLGLRHVGGAVLGFFGAALLVTEGRFEFATAALPGYAFALGAALIWSTYSLFTKRVGDFPTSAVAAFCLVSGTLALGCHAVFEPRYVPSGRDIPYLLWIGAGPMGAAFYLWDRAMKRGDPRVIGTLSYFAALLSTLLIVVLGEGRLTALSAVAMMAIVGGAVLGTWSRETTSARVREIS